MLDRPVPYWAEGGTRRFVLKCSSECEVCFRVALSPLFSSSRKSTLVKERGCPCAEPPWQAERGEVCMGRSPRDAFYGEASRGKRFKVRTCQTLSLSVLHYRLFFQSLKHTLCSLRSSTACQGLCASPGELSAHTQVDCFVCVCVCVWVWERENWYIWFMRTQICIITWVLQHEGGLWGHCLCPRKPKGLKKH